MHDSPASGSASGYLMLYSAPRLFVHYVRGLSVARQIPMNTYDPSPERKDNPFVFMMPSRMLLFHFDVRFFCSVRQLGGRQFELCEWQFRLQVPGLSTHGQHRAFFTRAAFYSPWGSPKQKPAKMAGFCSYQFRRWIILPAAKAYRNRPGAVAQQSSC